TSRPKKGFHRNTANLLAEKDPSTPVAENHEGSEITPAGVRNADALQAPPLPSPVKRCSRASVFTAQARRGSTTLRVTLAGPALCRGLPGLLAGPGQGPQLHGRVVGARRQGLAVRGKSHAEDGPAVAFDHGDLLPGGQVEQARGRVAAAQRQGLAVRGKR